MKLLLFESAALCVMFAVLLTAGCTTRPVGTINPIFKACITVPLSTSDREWQLQWDAQQEIIDEFRRCQTLTVQGEFETWKHYIARIGREPQPGSCLVSRKRPQNPGDTKLLFMAHTHDVMSIGGTFDGSIPVEEETK